MKFNKEVILEANDLDSTSSISYAIVEGNNDNLVAIDRKTGKLKLTNAKRPRVNNGTHLHEYILRVEVRLVLRQSLFLFVLNLRMRLVYIVIISGKRWQV